MQTAQTPNSTGNEHHGLPTNGHPSHSTKEGQPTNYDGRKLETTTHTRRKTPPTADPHGKDRRTLMTAAREPRKHRSSHHSIWETNGPVASAWQRSLDNLSQTTPAPTPFHEQLQYQGPHQTIDPQAKSINKSANIAGKHDVKSSEPLHLKPEEFIKTLSSGKKFTPGQPVIVTGDVRYTQNLNSLYNQIRCVVPFKQKNAGITHQNLQKNSDIKSHPIFLPEDLIIKGTLNLSFSPGLNKLPNKLTVEGDCYITNCKNLKTFSKEMIVSGSLYLGHIIPDSEILILNLGKLLHEERGKIFNTPSGITQWGDYLEVGKDLNCDSLKHRNLPESMIIRGNLSVRNSCITSLPKVIEFGSNINISGCQQLKELPDWAFSLKPNSEGKPRVMFMQDTGLTDETKNKLTQTYPVITIFC